MDVGSGTVSHLQTCALRAWTLHSPQGSKAPLLELPVHFYSTPRARTFEARLTSDQNVCRTLVLQTRHLPSA